MKLKYLLSTNHVDLKTIDKITNENKKIIKLSGWIKTYRQQTDLFFMSLNDGSSQKNIQIIFDKNNTFCNNIQEIYDKLKKLSVGASIELEGILVKPPETSKEKVELHIINILHMGIINDRKTYILSKGRVKPSIMRQHQHLRCKTNYFSTIMKIRSRSLHALNSFFDKNSFYHVDPNIVTTSDCEGAGEVFQIVAPEDKINGGKDDFFNKKSYLTVSSQLQLEAVCGGLGSCYTMNPSFRAEKSNTSRHLASFTHVEYESSFGGLDELMNLSENMIKYVIKECLEKCEDEYIFLNNYYSKGIINRLNGYLKCDFKRISYDDAIDIIHKLVKKKKLKVKVLPKWGDDLGSVCEKFLAEKYFKQPIMVYNYPKSLKSFYMKEDENNDKVVNCMDMLIPHIGELIGSSVREDNYDKLLSNMSKKNIDTKPLDWYLDLRKNGTWRHYGGGLGFERLVGLLTMDSNNFNIRDCCAFPVAYGECKY
jgi:asparaginyl-tRNA synthetase